jgi:hypothetical protein
MSPTEPGLGLLGIERIRVRADHGHRDALERALGLRVGVATRGCAC